MKIFLDAKCSDLCYTTITDDKGFIIFENDGYVPRFKGIGGGKYLDIQIDNKTGKIIGWVPLTQEEVDELIKEYE